MAAWMLSRNGNRIATFLKPVVSWKPLAVCRGKKLWVRPYLKELYKRRLAAGPEPERPRSIWVNWNYDAELYSFGKRLGEELKPATVRWAFTNSSYVLEEQARRSQLEMPTQSDLSDNTELAIAGERVANEYIRAYLHRCWPLLPPEGLQSVTDYLMNEDMLSYVASNLGLKDLILTTEFPPSKDSLCQAFKAVIGAIEKDESQERAELFVRDFLLTQLVGKTLQDLWTITNPMGILADTLAKLGRGPPEPRLLWSSASETIMAAYMVGIYSDKRLVGKGAGETVLIAEEMAARNSLVNLLQLSDSRAPLPFDPPPPPQRMQIEEDRTVDGRQHSDAQRQHRRQ